MAQGWAMVYALSKRTLSLSAFSLMADSTEQKCTMSGKKSGRKGSVQTYHDRMIGRDEDEAASIDLCEHTRGVTGVSV